MVNDVEKAWEDVEGKHQNYVALLEELDGEVQDTWLGELEDAYRDVRISFVKCKKQIEHGGNVDRFVAFETSFTERVSEIEKHIHRKSAVATIGRELNTPCGNGVEKCYKYIQPKFWFFICTYVPSFIFRKN